MARRIVVSERSLKQTDLGSFLPQILQSLGRRIVKLRRTRGFSQESFAEECGLHRTAMGLLERGKSIPRLDTLLLISRGLGITLSRFFSGVGGPR